MTSNADRETLTALLTKHEEFYPSGCECGTYLPKSLDVLRHRDEHRDHLATLLAEYGLATRKEAREAALREASAALRDAGYSHDGLPRRTIDALTERGDA